LQFFLPALQKQEIIFPEKNNPRGNVLNMRICYFISTECEQTNRKFFKTAEIYWHFILFSVYTFSFLFLKSYF